MLQTEFCLFGMKSQSTKTITGRRRSSQYLGRALALIRSFALMDEVYQLEQCWMNWSVLDL